MMSPVPLRLRPVGEQERDDLRVLDRLGDGADLEPGLLGGGP